MFATAGCSASGRWLEGISLREKSYSSIRSVPGLFINWSKFGFKAAQVSRFPSSLSPASDEIMESLFPGSEWADSKALAKFDRREVIQVLTQAQKDAYGTRANGMAENQPPVFGMTR